MFLYNECVEHMFQGGVIMNNKVISMDKPKARRTFQVKSKLRICLFVTFVLILMISLASSFFLKGKAMEAPDHYLSWNVSHGDTLWSIAGSNLPRGRDIRDFISEIKEINHLQTSNILVGQHLRIPVYSGSGSVLSKLSFTK